MNKTTTRNKYLMFFAIGIISFYLSGYILRGIHPPQSIYLMLLVYWILFGIGILVCKERSRGFVAKAFAISFAAMFLISIAFFAWGAYNHINSKAIGADLLQSAPDDLNFVVLTEEELNEYPAIREAITSQQFVEVKPDEWQRSKDFLSEKSSHTVKFGDRYYDIGFITA
ncbi:MAG: hypothetical protein Q7J10_04730 [Methanosarcinaceae archaeon]|nr:hypothetical protein [Methanosarcinaceae archaeon]